MNPKNVYAPLELAPAQQLGAEQHAGRESTQDWRTLSLGELATSTDPDLLAAVAAVENSVRQADSFEAIQGQRD